MEIKIPIKIVVVTTLNSLRHGYGTLLEVYQSSNVYVSTEINNV